MGGCGVLVVAALLYLTDDAIAIPAATWVGGVKQLFVDDSLIASTRGGVVRVMNSPTKLGHRVLQPDAPWEKALGTSFGLYNTVLREEYDGRNVTRLWYFNVREPNTTSRPYLQSYADSPDGISFTKPSLSQASLNGTAAEGIPNNVLGALSGDQQREGVSVWNDPHEALGGRYVTQAKVYSGPGAGTLAFSVSHDGLHWNASHEFQPGAGGCDTQSVVFFDDRRGEYALYTRQWKRPPSTRDSYRTVRQLSARSQNEHGLEWTAQQTTIAPDAFDNATHCHDEFTEPPVDYYGGIVYQYPEAGNGSYYFMLLPRLHHWTDTKSGWTSPMSKPGGPATIDVGLAVSRDGINFTQVGGRMPFIPVGTIGGWESQMTWGLPSPVIMTGGIPERPSAEIWIYYAGTNINHDGVVDVASVTGAKQSGISIARLRLDGWVSMDAPLTALLPGQVGASEILTVPMQFEGNTLELNADPSGQGSVYVEIQSRDGKPFKGFALADALPIITNGVNVAVRWQDDAKHPRSDVSSLAGIDVRLRFVMTGCKLFAFQFAKV